ncbi:MAG TPA: hypothetical protein VGO93_28710 [Candidatus Xenobia bacterium]|jgi:hypothetical protein
MQISATPLASGILRPRLWLPPTVALPVDVPRDHVETHPIEAAAAIGLAVVAGLEATGGLAALPGLPPPQATSAYLTLEGQPSPLTAVIRTHFNQWDANQDHVLTAPEITRALQDPKNHGDAGTALAVLHHLEVTGHDTIRFTPDMLAKYEKGYAAGDNTQWDALYSEYGGNQEWMASHPGLFRPGGPQMLDVTQGDLGDCWLDSMLGDYARLHPEAVQQMIQTHPDGSYTVTFPGHLMPVQVRPLTDGEKALYSSGHPNGEWQLVLEKAAGQVKPWGAPAWPGTRTAFDKLDQGGFMAEYTIQLLTGHGSNVYFLNSAGVESVPLLYDGFSRIATGAPVSAHSAEGQVAKVRTLLTQAEADHKLVAASTPQKNALFNLPDSHYEAFIHYDPLTDQVTIWNQWQDEPSDSHKTMLHDGEYTMSLADFCQGFQRLTIEK